MTHTPIITTAEDLQGIRNCRKEDFHRLLQFIKARWTYPEGFTVQLLQENDLKRRQYFTLRLNTFGNIDNEILVKTLLKNTPFKKAHYKAWEAGGIYIFKVYLQDWNFYRIVDYCKATNTSRAKIAAISNGYEWLIFSQTKRYIRPARQRTGAVIDFSKSLPVSQSKPNI